METTHVMVEGRAISLAIRRLTNARRITLRLSAARDGIILTLPKRTPVTTGMRFFHSKSSWVLEHVTAGSPIPFIEGMHLPLLGTPCIIQHAQGRGITRMETQDGQTILYVHGDKAFTKRRVTDFVKKIMLAHCVSRANALAGLIGKKVTGVRLRDMRSCWGTCSAKGIISFNWRLVFAPSEVLEYLIAHEVAHLAEMNHSAKFWKTVALLTPHTQKARKCLKKEGYMLHLYG